MFTADYGFIVDYIAEVLKVLRKEDYSKSYQKYFELSNTITTRDKTAIEKTFSGLVKVIYPDGEFTESDAKEILDFAIEGRKRVKDQLRKMDETFNDEVVNFEYTDRSGKLFKIETLEVLEYGDPKLGIETSSNLDATVELTELQSQKLVPESKPLEGIHQSIRDNQTNISYKKLFGNYLVGATNYTIKDPYIRLPYQFRNFIELCRLIAELKSNDSEIKIHLVTNNNEDYIANAKESFSELIDSLTSLGIDLSYEFSNVQHDRSIEMDNGWKIILGRGLDLWQKTSGRYDIAEYYQEKRLCKEFEITVIKSQNV